MLNLVWGVIKVIVGIILIVYSLGCKLSGLKPFEIGDDLFN